MLVRVFEMAAALKRRVAHARGSRVESRRAELYEKYGFRRAGVRRRYYWDNNEDALIMWTEAPS